LSTKLIAAALLLLLLVLLQEQLLREKESEGVKERQPAAAHTQTHICTYAQGNFIDFSHSQ